MLELYVNIKKRREELGMSQETLAKLVGYSNRSTIARIERGDIDISQSMIVKLANALQTTPGELMGWYDDSWSDSHGFGGDLGNGYYLDPEVAELAKQLYERPEIRVFILDGDDEIYVGNAAKTKAKKILRILQDKQPEITGELYGGKYWKMEDSGYVNNDWSEDLTVRVYLTYQEN